ncbi:MAG: DUF1697 domain-containing protein [Acidobacteriota bacterium]|nr:DUF1697 domain-containing protein [Acidobacteriota bacterium]
MAVSVVLLRGINLGPRNRIAMPALREALLAAGYASVRTYVQSGNIVLDSEQRDEALADAIAALLVSEFALELPVVVRSADELADAVARNPFVEQAAASPKALQVTFRAEAVTPEVVAALRVLAGPSEKLAGSGRELYSWHPDGVARSKLALALTPKYAAATARNWTTVLTLLEMATADAA